MAEKPDYLIEDDASRYLAERAISNEDIKELREKQSGKPYPLYCSFCGKAQNEVACLIAGPTVFICDECVDLCSAIVAESKKPKPPTVPTE